MAEFCWQCTAEEYGEEYASRNDFRDKRLGEGWVTFNLCEGCGLAATDREGRCTEHADPTEPHSTFVPHDPEVVQ